VSERGSGRGYRVYVIAFDMEGRTEGDHEDFRRALSRLESEFPGAQLLGTKQTRSWPTYSIMEAVRE
jgi:hypothetical protein